MSFSIETTAPGGTPLPAAPAAVRAGVIGGGSSLAIGGGEFAPRDVNSTDATMRALLKMGGDALAPAVAAEENALFFRGVQEALTGEAIQDIVRDQPWYSQLFGPNSVVEGARAYTSQKAVTDFATQWQTDMPELRKVAPDKLGPVLAQRMGKLMTGDPIADSAAQREMMAQLPALVKGQAKEHFAWNQTNAISAQQSAIASAAGLVQQRKRSSTLSPDDNEAVEVLAMGALKQPPGMTDESYVKSVSGALILAAGQGNLHFVSTARKYGVLASLPADTAKRIEDAYERYGAKSVQQMPEEYTNELFLIHRAARQLGTNPSPQAVMQRMGEFNAKWSAYSGYDGGFFSSKQVAAEGLTAMEAIYQNIKARTGSTEKADTQWRQMQDISVAVRTGNAGALPGSYKSDLDGYVQSQWNTSTPQQRAQMLVMNAYPTTGPSGGPGTVFEPIKQTLQQSLALTTAGPTQDFRNSYEQWRAIQEADKDPVTGKWRDITARQYYGKVNDSFHAYHRQVEQGLDPVAAHTTAFIEAPRLVDTDADSRKLIQGAVKSNWQRWFGAVFGDVPNVSDESARALSTYLSTEYAEARARNPGHDPAALAESLTKSAMQAGSPYDWLGAHIVYTPKGQPKIAEALKLPANAVGSVVTQLVSEKGNALRIDTDKAVVRRVFDDLGNPRLYVQGFKDGVMQHFYIEGGEIVKQYEKRFDALGNPIRPKPGATVGTIPDDQSRPAIFYRY